MKLEIDKKELLRKIRRGPKSRNLSTRVHEDPKHYKRSRQKHEDSKEINEEINEGL